MEWRFLHNTQKIHSGSAVRWPVTSPDSAVHSVGFFFQSAASVAFPRLPSGSGHGSMSLHRSLQRSFPVSSRNSLIFFCVYVCVCVCVCVFFFRPIDGGPSNYGAVSFLFWRWNDSIEFREFFFISHPPSSPRPCCSIDRRAHLNLHRQITSMRSRKRQHWCIDRTGRALANTRKSLDQKSTRLRIKLDTTMPRFSFLIRQPIRCWSTLSVQFDDQGNESLWCGKLFHRFDWCTAAFVFACHLISLTLFIWNDIKRSNFKVWWSTSLFDSFLSPRETKRTGFWPSHCGLNGLLLTSMGVETLVWILLRK